MLNLFKSLKEKLAKTRNSFVGKIAEALSLRTKVDEELMEDLEEILIQADVGAELSMEIIEKLRVSLRLNNVTEASEVQQYIEKIIHDIMMEDYENFDKPFHFEANKPSIVLIVGVNGTGKTTTIGKFANKLKKEGKKVMLIAADTFRAAAIEQLTIWAERSSIPIFKTQHGADPSSVVYDGLNYATKHDIDVVLIDTAGRQHNKVNLMNELAKIHRTIQKIYPEAPHETLLVVDATTGQNAISQAKFFNEATKLTGLVLSKLDGTAKGGIVISIKRQLNIPVKLVGVGEAIEDLRDFDPQDFSNALFQ
ncbi:MAG TPA: signal recognition particle-docking protein FtsY [Candidatus Cloacimonadota bacterium]|nr:signal recognition particle-docking protein FtsY [Candidatus Cloacimonadota bacterium]HPM00964.1 signal recognition particle-docking protein FtsY [Candidatus Cloacimonadota bacterium]